MEMVEKIAVRLFPDDVADGSDCRREFGREGQPCMICADKNERWLGRKREVREALVEEMGEATEAMVANWYPTEQGRVVWREMLIAALDPENSQIQPYHPDAALSEGVHSDRTPLSEEQR